MTYQHNSDRLTHAGTLPPLAHIVQCMFPAQRRAHQCKEDRRPRGLVNSLLCIRPSCRAKLLRLAQHCNLVQSHTSDAVTKDTELRHNRCACTMKCPEASSQAEIVHARQAIPAPAKLVGPRSHRHHPIEPSHCGSLSFATESSSRAAGKTAAGVKPRELPGEPPGEWTLC